MSQTRSKIASVSRAMKLAAVPLVLASLSACATGFNADVQRFQSQLPAPEGQSFAVVADDPALAGGLEFSQYADFVESQMERLGYAQATPEDATLLVRFDYGIDTGRERIRQTGFYDPWFSSWRGYRPFYGRTRYYRSRYGRRGFARFSRRGSWGYGFYDPWFDGGLSSYTVFTSGIDLKIDRVADGQRLFEGKAQALSTSNRLGYLVPNLVEAMFTNFPGNSGETVRISIKPEDMPVRKVNL